MSDLALLNSADGVAVVLRPGGFAPGDPWAVGAIGGVATSVIPHGHKLAIRDFAPGDVIVKYGVPIAIATVPIAMGDHVHIHNAAMPTVSEEADDVSADPWQPTSDWDALPDRFTGYVRDNGRAATRNYVVVAATVNCSATVVKAICRRFEGADFATKDIHGVVPLTHGSGCAQSIGGAGYQVLNRTLAGSIFHPNVVGAVVVGLGCEGTTIDSILHARSREDAANEVPIERLGVQEAGGTEEAVRSGIAAVERLLARLPAFRRESLPVSHLRLALNCGGSDAFSGLTANPALGVASDILVSKGGTTVLAEIPECHGAEAALHRRAATPAVRIALRSLFDWWKGYARKHNVELNDNLAPGNIAGGITTIVEKSLGAVAKAGTSPLVQIVDYAERISVPGFVLMNTPGFDPVSVTGLVAGGCNLVAFTTGRGSAFGSSLAPTLKITTNTDLFNRMRGDMDVDAGPVLEHGGPARVGARIYDHLVKVASGETTCSERLGLGREEFIPWVIGETL